MRTRPAGRDRTDRSEHERTRARTRRSADTREALARRIVGAGAHTSLACAPRRSPDSHGPHDRGRSPWDGGEGTQGRGRPRHGPVCIAALMPSAERGIPGTCETLDLSGPAPWVAEDRPSPVHPPRRLRSATPRRGRDEPAVGRVTGKLRRARARAVRPVLRMRQTVAGARRSPAATRRSSGLAGREQAVGSVVTVPIGASNVLQRGVGSLVPGLTHDLLNGTPSLRGRGAKP